jgi:hypothetical protein
MSDGADEDLENEWFAIRHSGETPEIALYSSIYFLTEADDGPKLCLTEEQLALLKEAASDRYREIVLRDLQPQNRDKAIYRGIKRSIVNLKRFECFCRRQHLDSQSFRAEVAAALLLFLATECVDTDKGGRRSSINCSFRELNDFARKVGLVAGQLPRHIASICPD